EVRFRRDTEELFRSGLFVRSRAWCTLVLARADSGDLRIVDHRLEPRPVEGGETYSPADPFTWGDAADAAERLVMEGLEHHRRGEVASAGRAFQQAALEVERGGVPAFAMGPEPFQAQLSYFLAVTALQQDRRAEAYARVEEALGFNRRFPLALNLLARLRFDDNEVEAAAALWEESGRADPGQQEVVALVGYLREALAMKEPEVRDALLALVDAPAYQILEDLAGLRDRFRRELLLVHLSARAHLSGGEAEAASVLLEKIPVKRRTAESHYLLGRAFLLQDKADRALAEFRRAWAAEPGYRDALTWLVEISLARARRLEALSFAEEGRRTAHPEGPGVLSARIGLMELDEGRLYEATAHLKDAASTPLPAPLREAVGAALRRLLAEGR
ncbi:MAG: hypothetical protein FJ098_09860, partial [Deltaproteobacteria bacterium]|nr:hypothetical protein [Deltaproteobacteria bacterium]